MAKQQTSFEDRLARIEQSRGGPSAPPPPTPPSGPRPPGNRGNGGGHGRMIGAFVGVFFAATAIFTIVTLDESTLVTSSFNATEDELAGKHTLATVLQSDALTGAKWAPALAVLFAKHKLQSDDVTPEQERKLQAFIQNKQGKSMADIVRENLRGRLMRQARKAGGQPLADEIAAKLDACRSITCLETVNSLFMLEYNNGRP